jgi:DNA repair protein RecO (recombination protein O)
MRITNQPAYVLHARAWRETSLLVEALTFDFGRVGLVARGVRGPRARLPRSLLEPLQALRVAWSGRGELGTLAAVEPDGAPHRLHSEAMLAALYVNELLVRLTARNDPQPALFARYAVLLGELSDARSLAWCLRCFERDLLAALGYALRLDVDADTGAPIDPARVYAYIPGHGPVAAGGDGDGVRVHGTALLAMNSDIAPNAGDLTALRRLMRTLIGVHLGPRGLQSWRVLAGPARVGRHPT